MKKEKERESEAGELEVILSVRELAGASTRRLGGLLPCCGPEALIAQLLCLGCSCSLHYYHDET